MKKLLLFGFATALFLTACKKKTEDVVVKTTAQKVQGVWKVTSTVSNDYYSNANHFTTTNGLATDYADFRADGKVYSQTGNPNTPGAKDTSVYTIVNDNLLKIDGLDFNIKTLTDNQFVFANKVITLTAPLEFDEITFNLYK